MQAIIKQIAVNNPMLAEHLEELNRIEDYKTLDALVVRYIEGLQNLLTINKI